MWALYIGTKLYVTGLHLDEALALVRALATQATPTLISLAYSSIDERQSTWRSIP